MSSKVTPANVRVSVGLTVKSSPAIRCDTISAATSPTAAPSTASYRPWRKTIVIITFLLAPSARRMPMSCVRSLTKRRSFHRFPCPRAAGHLRQTTPPFPGESPHRKRTGENVVQGLRAEGRKLRIDGLDLRAHLGGDGGGIDLSAHVERKKLGALVDVEVDLLRRILHSLSRKPNRAISVELRTTCIPRSNPRRRPSKSKNGLPAIPLIGTDRRSCHQVSALAKD